MKEELKTNPDEISGIPMSTLVIGVLSNCVNGDESVASKNSDRTELNIDGVYYAFAKLSDKYPEVFHRFLFKEIRRGLYHSKLLEDILFDCTFWNFLSFGKGNHRPYYLIDDRMKEINLGRLRNEGATERVLANLKCLSDCFMNHYKDYEKNILK